MKATGRLIIYFFYDKDGIADRYVDYMLNGLKPNADKFIIVVNGTLTPESREMFKKYSDDIIIRKNEGLDAWAYKEALEYEGWDKLSTYYEVCMLNATIMGPVYPFEEMFSAMDKKTSLDFWGITRHLGEVFDPFNCNPYGYLPEHIQSHFIVYRNKFLKEKSLKKFWDKLPKIENYEESIGKYESYFTKFFSDMGFRWDTYINNQNEANYTNYYLMFAPRKAIEVDRCPVFKRRTFFHDRYHTLSLTNGEACRELFWFLKNKTNYNTDLILENLIRTTNQYDLLNSLQLTYVLPSDIECNNKSFSRIALIIHLYYMDLIDETVHYASSMSEEMDIYITTPQKEHIDDIKKAFSFLPNKIQFRIIENRGRDVSSLLVACKDIIDKYDYICFYHDKKVTQVKQLSIGRSFSYKVSESVLHNKIYVKNIIGLFDSNKRLGLLTNTTPYHGVYLDTLGGEWGPNFYNTKLLAEKLKLNVNIDITKPPIAPLGTGFWFRTKAMKKLIELDWKYEDFPAEPNKNDGTLLHAIERVYPFVVQSAGYYPAYVMPDTFASIEINNLFFMTRVFNEKMQRKGIHGNLFSKSEILDNLSIAKSKYMFLKAKKIARHILSEKMYFKLAKIKHKVFD